MKIGEALEIIVSTAVIVLGPMLIVMNFAELMEKRDKERKRRERL